MRCCFIAAPSDSEPASPGVSDNQLFAAETADALQQQKGLYITSFIQH